MADSTGAEGGTPFSFTSDPPAVNGYVGPTDNIVASCDVTSVANDSPSDRDYDDPYPGGPTNAPLLPTS